MDPMHGPVYVYLCVHSLISTYSSECDNLGVTLEGGGDVILKQFNLLLCKQLHDICNSRTNTVQYLMNAMQPHKAGIDKNR